MLKKSKYLLLLLVIIALFSIPSLALEADPIVRVGLSYGSSALECANLSYENGGGYNLGYYDSSNRHVSLYTIYDKRVTILTARDYTYSNRAFTLGSGDVGIYHAEIDFATSDVGQAVDLLDTASAYDGSAYIAYIDGDYRVRVGNYVSQNAASAITGELSSRVGYPVNVVSSKNSYRVANTDTGVVLFEFSNGGLGLGVETFANSGAPSTWHRNEIYLGGFRFTCSSSGNINVVNILHVQDYIKGVVPYEMVPTWHIEALKAQALCAKNYVIANLGRHKEYDFDVCSTIHCQVYRGIRAATDLSNSAVDAIYGQYITCNGEIISAYYHSSNGGSTESAKNVWGTEVPYLQAVVDNYENINSIPNGTWRKEITAAQITQLLRDKGVSTSEIVEAYVETFTPAGNVYKLTFINSSGQPLSYTGEKARTILGSYTISQRYTISGSSSALRVYGGSLSGGFANTYAIGAGSGVSRIAQQASQITIITSAGKKTGVELGGGSSGAYVIEGKGYGHNVGMSQYGAKGMAEAGFTYDEIIKHYYTGVEINYTN